MFVQHSGWVTVLDGQRDWIRLGETGLRDVLWRRYLIGNATGTVRKRKKKNNYARATHRHMNTGTTPDAIGKNEL